MKIYLKNTKKYKFQIIIKKFMIISNFKMKLVNFIHLSNKENVTFLFPDFEYPFLKGE
jgi:hypothetical protein